MGGQMAPQQAPMQMPQQQPQPQAPGFFGRLNQGMQSPLFLTGASILANNTGNYGAAAPAIGRGLVGGQMATSQMQEDALQGQFRQMQMAEARQRLAKEEQYAARVERYIQQLPFEQRAAAMLNPEAFVKAMIEQQYGGSQTQYGLTPHYETDKEGNYYAIRYGSDGRKIEEKLDRVPMTLEMRTPGYMEQQAEARARGGEIGKQTGQAQINYNVAIDKADQGLRVIEDLLASPALESAVGWQSRFPTFPGSEVANYELKLKQLEGKNFLEAYESLKGGGQITEVEGQKATQAISDIALAQSDAQHRKSLETLREIYTNAKRRAAERAGYNKQLTPGHTENGFRFKGGDPGKQENWERL